VRTPINELNYLSISVLTAIFQVDLG